MRTLWSLALVLCLMVVGCGESSENPADVAAADDGAQGEVQEVGPTEDGLPSDGSSELDGSDVKVEPALILGVNEVLQKHPSAFTPLDDGGTLEIELGGFNGLWMIVLSFKTRGYFPGRVIVFADVNVAGEEIAGLSLSKQSLESGGDGWDYYYDLFLIVTDTSVGGETALVNLTVRDYEGSEFEVSLQQELLIVGGNPPFWPEG